MDNSRDLRIDCAKTVAIILVVVGHSVQYVFARDSFDDNLLFRYIYSFHMPLFMFISGYLSFNKNINYIWLKNRFISLVIPFLSWIILGYYISGSYKQITLFQKIKDILLTPDNGGMWFLWVLFLNCFIFFLSNNLYNKIRNTFEIKTEVFFKIIIFLFATVAIRKIASRFWYFGINSCSWYIVFYFAGHLVGTFKPLAKKYWTNKLGITTFIGFFILTFFWRRTENPIFLNAINEIFPHIVTRCILKIYTYIVPFLGIACIFCIINKIAVFNLYFLSYIGRHTIEIYVLQWYFIRTYTGIIVVDTLLSIILAIIIPLIIAKVVERYPKINLVLFGKRRTCV